MKGEQSYSITLKNNESEKEAIQFLIDKDHSFLNPSKESRKLVMELLNLVKRNSRAFDLILIPGQSNLNEIIKLKQNDKITLVELKTTKKELPNNPAGFFFGATENEFKLADLLGDKYKFCFVTLHENSSSYKLLTLNELEPLIKTKRIQYQINLKR
ncbi:MAG: hypothetical protein AAGA77_25035 [Bacteroidota bacterium]